MINIEADLRPVVDTVTAAGYFMRDFDSNDNMDALTGLMAETSAVSFNNFIDSAAVANPERLGHMYEYGQLGEAHGRLWSMIIAGTPKQKVLSYNFKESQEEVPAGEDETGIAGDTRTGGHVFKWKAAVVENGIQVHIDPINGRFLAIPAQEAGRRGQNKGGTMYFTSNTVSPKPNQIAKGAFTESWIMHFATTANVVMERTIVDYTEEWLDTQLPRMINRIEPAKVNPVPRAPQAKIAARPSAKRAAKSAYRLFRNTTETLYQAARASRIGDNLD